MAQGYPATLDLELSSWRQCFHNRRVYCRCIFIVPEITPDLHGDNVFAIGAYLVGAYTLFLKSLPIFMETMFLRLAHMLLVHIHCSWNQTDFNGDNVSANWRISCCCIFIVPEITPDFHGNNVSAIGAYLVGAYSLFLKSLPIFVETMFLRLAHILLVHIHCSWNQTRYYAVAVSDTFFVFVFAKYSAPLILIWYIW